MWLRGAPTSAWVFPPELQQGGDPPPSTYFAGLLGSCTPTRPPWADAFPPTCSRRRHRSRRRAERGGPAWGTGSAVSGAEQEQETGTSSANRPSSPSPQSLTQRWAWSPGQRPPPCPTALLSASTSGFWHPRLPNRLRSLLAPDSNHHSSVLAGLNPPENLSLAQRLWRPTGQVHQAMLASVRKERFRSCWTWYEQKLPALSSFRRVAKSHLTVTNDQPQQEHKGTMWVHPGLNPMGHL